jgi:glycosyltransferase involved in cell wall biosynthesis
MQSIAVSVVRNCRDIISLSVLHHVLLGVDRCIVIDNGSTDGTLELLHAIAERIPKVEIRSDPSAYQQAEMVNGAINEYTTNRRTLIVPFDADEFWDAPVGAVTQWMEQGTVDVIANPVVNFVQSRSVTAPTRFSWLRAFRTVRTTFPGKAPLYDRQCSFVEIEYPRKMIFCAEGKVSIGIGAHDVQMPDRKLAFCDQFCCLHLPLRSKAELAKRAFDHEPRRAPYRQDPDHSWHVRYIHEMMSSGEGEALWRANSYDGSGTLDNFGQHRTTKIDMRLVRRMARAYAYGLYLRIPMGPHTR